MLSRRETGVVEPRWLLTLLAVCVLSLGAGFLLGFWLVDREERKACEPGKPCADPRTRGRMKIMLWTATAIAVLSATFPSWQDLVP